MKADAGEQDGENATEDLLAQGERLGEPEPEASRAPTAMSRPARGRET